MGNKRSISSKELVKVVVTEGLKAIPFAGTAISVADEIATTMENNNLKERISELEQKGILEEISGITFYLNNIISKENIEKLTHALNTDYKEYINIELMLESTVDEVLVFDNSISINFTDLVEKEYVNNEVAIHKEEIMSYIEESYITISKIAYY